MRCLQSKKAAEDLLTERVHFIDWRVVGNLGAFMHIAASQIIDFVYPGPLLLKQRPTW
jgi:hypothetical protein